MNVFAESQGKKKEHDRRKQKRWTVAEKKTSKLYNISNREVKETIELTMRTKTLSILKEDVYVRCSEWLSERVNEGTDKDR